MKNTLELDTVGLHVLHNALTNIAAEMALVMMKTSYSTIFNEGLDFSTVLLDADGNLIAEKNYTPSMMGAIPNTVRWTLEEFGPEFFEPGDVVVHNDPYRGNCHLPEHMMMKPIFREGELLGFAGNMGHIAEVGGKAPGSFASDATDVYQEGLRLPPVKLMEGGRYNEDLWRVVLANHRTPRNTWGDFHAMIGALNVGERRLLALIGPLRRRDGARGRTDADRLLGPAAARRDRRDRRRQLRGVDGRRGRRRDERSVRGEGQARGPRRRGDRRLHRLEPAGARPDERHVRRRRVGRLQRDVLRRRSADADPAQLGLLSADPADRAAGLGRERPPPGPLGGRQHGPAAEARRPRPRRVLAGRPGASRGGVRRVELQPAVRRRASRDRPLLLELPLRRHGGGRHGAQGRQQRRDHAALELPQHPGRGVRAPVSAADASSTRSHPTPAERASTAAASRRRGRFASRPTRSRSARSSIARRSRRRASSAGSPAVAPSCSSAGTARASSAASTRCSALPRRRSSPTSSFAAGTSCATGHPAAAASAIRCVATPGSSAGTSPRATSASRPRSATTESTSVSERRWVELEHAVVRDEHGSMRRLRSHAPAPGVDVRGW